MSKRCATPQEHPTSERKSDARLSRKCSCGNTAKALCKTCSACASDHGQRIQLGEAHGADEQAADRAARQAVSGRDVTGLSTGRNQLQRSGSGAGEQTLAPPLVNQVLASPGRSLSADTRQYFEPRFHHDFSRVRVHRGGRADQSAHAVSARAYTVGNHIVFANGEYRPETAPGRELIAHELAHVVQQARSPGQQLMMHRRKKGPGSCGWLDEAASTVLGGAAHLQIQAKLATRGLAMELPIPRASKSNPLDVMSRKCQPPEVNAGFCDVAKIERPNKLSVSEIKPFWRAGTSGRLEALHYKRRAAHSKQRVTGTGQCGKRTPGPDDAAFSAVVGPLTASSSVVLLKGAIKGTENFGTFVRDPTKDLIAKEVSAGAIGYWCRNKKKPKKKKSKKKDKPKNKKSAKKSKPKKPKKPRKPKAPRPQGGASAASIGIGISIMSANVGAANAGAGISVGSTSATFGTAGAGISWFSDTAAAGSAGAGVAKDSMSAGAATAGAGISEDSESAAVGAVGAGKMKGSSTAGAGVAGVGTVEDSQSAGAGVAAAGDVKDSSVAAAGGAGKGRVDGVKGASAGSPKKPIEAKDVEGSGADKVPAGEEDKDAKDNAAATREDARGTEAGSGSDGSGSATGPTQGAAGGTGKAGGTQPQGGTQAGPGTSATGGQLAVMPITRLGASDADRAKAAAEATRVAKLLTSAQDGQKQLLEHLANKDSSGQYLVPTSEWVDKLLKVTQGLSAEDIEYLKSLDWTPGNISEEKLRERIHKALENKGKPKGDKGAGHSAAAPDSQAKGNGQGGKQAEGKGKQKDKGSAPAGKGGPNASPSGRYTTATPYTGEMKDSYVRDYQFVTSDNKITSKSKVGDKPLMTIQWIGDDKKAYYYRLGFEIVAGPTAKPDRKQKDVTWLYFDMDSTNTEIINVAPEGQKPMLIRPGNRGSYRVPRP